MSKITNDGLTRSDTGCFIAVLIRQQWALKGLNLFYIVIARPLAKLDRARFVINHIQTGYVLVATGRPISFSFHLSVRPRVRKFGIIWKKTVCFISVLENAVIKPQNSIQLLYATSSYRLMLLGC